ncbi:hypothetical protein HRbin12_00893 [bacterium HR12]|nr:hypothetical protein HRbin12_00893 [bacterium HR12]
MQIPATIPRPGSCESPWITSYPSPPPPTSPAMMTTESTIITVWFTPRRIEGRASGNCTFVSTCQRVDPNARAASTVSRGTCRIPVSVRRIPGGSA